MARERQRDVKGVIHEAPMMVFQLESLFGAPLSGESDERCRDENLYNHYRCVMGVQTVLPQWPNSMSSCLYLTSNTPHYHKPAEIAATSATPNAPSPTARVTSAPLVSSFPPLAV